jgi:hypothetical protein
VLHYIKKIKNGGKNPNTMHPSYLKKCNLLKKYSILFINENSHKNSIRYQMHINYVPCSMLPLLWSHFAGQ